MGVALGDRRGGRSPEGGVRVVEIAGPAGAGKTALLEALSQASPNIRPVARLRRMAYLGWLAATALGSTPLQVRRAGVCGLGRREMMMMMHLGALHHMVPRRSGGRIVTVFDQGPVFMLSRLYGSGVEDIEDERVQRWWRVMVRRWACVVDKVIWLDGPDTVLVQRIRTREKWHLTKEQSEQDAYEFLRRFRRTAEVILSRLGCVNGPRLVEFDTSRLGVNEIVDTLLDELLGEGRPARPSSGRERAPWE